MRSAPPRRTRRSFRPGAHGSSSRARRRSRRATGPAPLRIASGAAVALVLSVLADAGSRAGFLGTLTAAILFVLWSVTRLAAGPRPGVRQRVASAVGTLAILAALAFAAALAWP